MNDVMRSARAFIEATGQDVLGQISFSKVHTEDRDIVGKNGKIEKTIQVDWYSINFFPLFESINPFVSYSKVVIDDCFEFDAYFQHANWIRGERLIDEIPERWRKKTVEGGG